LSGASLAAAAGELLADGARRAEMARAMRTLARPDAAGRIVEYLFRVAGWPEPGVAGGAGVR
jgi:UDP-N-acetylglucosamine:LPS N-acetylglucosamine transferase